MMRASFKKGQKNGGGRSRFVGLIAAADRLGVNRAHLYRVLAGERVSVSLQNKVKLTPVPHRPGHKKVEVL